MAEGIFLQDRKIGLGRRIFQLLRIPNSSVYRGPVAKKTPKGGSESCVPSKAA